MLEDFNPRSCRRALAVLAKASRSMLPSSRALWQSRLEHLYGDMGGQRAVDLVDLQENLEVGPEPQRTADVLIALEAYFYLVCTAISYASFHTEPSRYLHGLTSLPPNSLRKHIEGLLSGSFFEEKGILGWKHAFDFDWITGNGTDDHIRTLAKSLTSFGSLWKGSQLASSRLDPFQFIHHALFPKNLIHITGQFYTPEWLAELLLADIGWNPRERLIDPFCGSGVFLVKALEFALSKGYSCLEVLPNILGIDLSPFAAAAARANLTLFIGRQRPRLDTPIHLNIISADSLAPAVTRSQKHSMTSLWAPSISIDGELISPPDVSLAAVAREVSSNVAHYGINPKHWLAHPAQTPDVESRPSCVSSRDRRIWEQLLVYCLKPADVVVTNPPWVGWEYISRPYRDAIVDAWREYDLFKVKGLDAAFLKEDLSSLALMVAWDVYLKQGGRSAVVLRPAIMHSDLAGRGVRRLSLRDDGAPINLSHIRTFQNLRVFEEASTETATWQVEKGRPTEFPVKVTHWAKKVARWNPTSDSSLQDVAARIRADKRLATRTDETNAESRWLITEESSLEEMRSLSGRNAFVPRMGVFTGGANSVFYLTRVDRSDNTATARYRNILERAKREAPSVEVMLEREIVFPVLRGRDVQMWTCSPEVYLLCPHTAETKMYPLAPTAFAARFPLAFEYLSSMRSILDERKSFAGWERKIQSEYFYTLQRIGDYTFAPYKVCWRYIASEFTVCVAGSDPDGIPILPNDKVMFIPFDRSDAAFFVAGVLSASRVRKYVNSSVIKRQISASAIKSLALPAFDGTSSLHATISSLCREGHGSTCAKDPQTLDGIRKELDERVHQLLGV